jgi:hypothetical protein
MHWDTTGQEQFRSIASLYLRGALRRSSPQRQIPGRNLPPSHSGLRCSIRPQVAPIFAVLAINKAGPKDALSPEVSGWVESHQAPFALHFFVSHIHFRLENP